MLPASVLDRLLATDATMKMTLSDDRRAGVRFNHDALATVYRVDDHRVSTRLDARLLEISAADLRIEIAEPDLLLGDWIISVGPDPLMSQPDSAILLCNTKRLAQVQDGVTQVGATIIAMLAPTQSIKHGRVVDTYVWIGCAKATPEDPFGTAHIAA